jgi:hypothetical protein
MMQKGVMKELRLHGLTKGSRKRLFRRPFKNEKYESKAQFPP